MKKFLIAQLSGAASILLVSAVLVLAFAAFVWAVKFARYVWMH